LRSRPVDGVGGAPWHLHVGGDALGEQFKPQLGFGLELQRGGDAHLRADLFVGQVLGRYVEPGVDQRVPARRAVGGVDEVDRVGDLAGAADVLALDSRGMGAGLLVAALIQHQYGQPTLVGQVLDDEVPHRRHRRERVP
jgi:hypothetical protein